MKANDIQVILRQEQEADYKQTEFVTREAFWNYYTPKCYEHYLLHIMRNSFGFVKELDFVAEVEGNVVGNVVYTKSVILADNGNKYEVLTLGPICVLPIFWRKGIARMLVEHTKTLAKQMGFRAIVLCGDPDIYSRMGFVASEDFYIRTADNKYFKALQVMELYDNALKGLQGRYVENEIYNVDIAAAEIFDKQFPFKPAIVGTPSQKRFAEILSMQKSSNETIL